MKGALFAIGYVVVAALAILCIVYNGVYTIPQNEKSFSDLSNAVTRQWGRVVEMIVQAVDIAKSLDNITCVECSGDDAAVAGAVAVGGGAAVAGDVCVACGGRRRTPAALLEIGGSADAGSVAAAGGASLANATVTTMLNEVTIIGRNITEPFDVVDTALSNARLYAENEWQGEWEAGRTYVPGALVTRSGALYRANATSTGQTPGTGGAPWRVINGTTGARGANGTGVPGLDALCTTAAPFVAPAVNASVAVAVACNTSWLAPGAHVYIEGSGQYEVTMLSPGTITVANRGVNNNTPSGATVPAGARVSAGGRYGPGGPCHTLGYRCTTVPLYGATLVLAAPIVYTCSGAATTTLCSVISTPQNIMFDPSTALWTGQLGSGFLLNGTYMSLATGFYRWTIHLDVEVAYAGGLATAFRPLVNLFSTGLSVQFRTYMLFNSSVPVQRESVLFRRTRFLAAGINDLRLAIRPSIALANGTLTIRPGSMFTVHSIW